MQKAIHSPKRERLCQILRTERQQANLRQVDLAEKLREPQSFVSKYESGERRLDLIELEQVCAALGIDLVTIVTKFVRGDL